MAMDNAGVLTAASLRMLRALRGLTQRDLADKAGVSLTSVSDFEQGTRQLRTDTVIKLCDALGVQVVYRVDGKDIPGP